MADKTQKNGSKKTEVGTKIITKKIRFSKKAIMCERDWKKGDAFNKLLTCPQ